MKLNVLTDYANRVNSICDRRLCKFALIVVLLVTVIATSGCNSIGNTDPNLVGTWISSTPKSSESNAQVVITMTLRADGTYERITSLLHVSKQTESGKWGVKDGQLNLKQDKVGTTTEKHSHKLNDKRDQLQLTGNGLGGAVAITYRKSS